VVPLLWVAVGCTLAIPVSSLLGWIAPGLGPWADGALVGVDATALVGALGLVWMARATARRVREGARDSVWAAPGSRSGGGSGSGSVGVRATLS
jgi:hypothetical protein